MKSELIHLLQKLSGALDGFQNLIIFPNGNVTAVSRFGAVQFASLADLEQWLYPPEEADPVVGLVARMTPEVRAQFAAALSNPPLSIPNY